MNRIEIHKGICDGLNELYKAKNADYGNSFTKVRDTVPNAILVRLMDKMNRLEKLMTKGYRQVQDEKIEDTLRDLANYAIMELTEMKVDEENKEFSIRVEGIKMKMSDVKIGMMVMKWDGIIGYIYKIDKEHNMVKVDWSICMSDWYDVEELTEIECYDWKEFIKKWADTADEQESI